MSISEVLWANVLNMAYHGYVVQGPYQRPMVSIVDGCHRRPVPSLPLPGFWLKELSADACLSDSGITNYIAILIQGLQGCK